jgi:dihydroorotate dehydrogenase
VAAGIDRTGAKRASLDLSGFGHIEIGTVTPGDRIELAERSRDVLVGVNFGSSRSGFCDEVVAEYCAALRLAYSHADYLCANLTSPRGERDGNSPSVVALLRRLCAERALLAKERGERKPLLVKLRAGQAGEPLPMALDAARQFGFDGIVLVSDDLRRIAGVKDRIGDLALFSVGGVKSAEQAGKRFAAGANFVQTHSAFAADGARALRPRD